MNPYQNGNNQNNNGNNNGPGGEGGPGKQNLILFIIVAVVTLVFVSTFMTALSTPAESEVSYDQFIKWVEADKVASVQMLADRINITLKDNSTDESTPATGGQNLFGFNANYGKTTYYTANLDDPTLIGRLYQHGVNFKGEVQRESSVIIYWLVNLVLPVLLVWGLLSLLFRRMTKTAEAVCSM